MPRAAKTEKRFLLMILLAASLAFGPAAGTPAKARDGRQDKQNENGQAKDRQPGTSTAAAPVDLDREVSHVLNRMKFSLEGGNAHDFLALIDSTRFDGYLRFKDTIERLMRDDDIRVYMQVATVSLTGAAGKARVILNAEMEVTRRDAAVETQIRRSQLVLDFARTPDGWRLTNITPRSYFDLL